jgi:hypothetical protein
MTFPLLFYSVVTVCHPEPRTPLPHYPVFFYDQWIFFSKVKKGFWRITTNQGRHLSIPTLTCCIEVKGGHSECPSHETIG